MEDPSGPRARSPSSFSPAAAICHSASRWRLMCTAEDSRVCRNEAAPAWGMPRSSDKACPPLLHCAGRDRDWRSVARRLHNGDPLCLNQIIAGWVREASIRAGVVEHAYQPHSGRDRRPLKQDGSNGARTGAFQCTDSSSTAAPYKAMRYSCTGWRRRRQRGIPDNQQWRFEVPSCEDRTTRPQI
jgi:hypothetical protein